MTLALISELFLPKFTRAQGRLSLPGSKSISNRVLLLAALAEGKTRLHGLLDSDDTRVMLSALRACGIQITTLEDGVAEVYGVYPFPYKSGDFFLGNAGTAVRPLTAALAVMGGRLPLARCPSHARTAYQRSG